MERKEFRSRLFRKVIRTNDPQYWEFLYAEVLFRMQALEDLNCPCSFCFSERIQYRNLIRQMKEDGHIAENKKAKNFTGVGDCGRRLGPVV